MKYKIHNKEDGNEVVTTSYIVHSFSVGDVDDPDVYAGQPIYDWQQSDAGKWIMENSIEKPSWHRHMDMNIYGYRYQIRAELTLEQLTYFKLKFE